MSRGAVGRHRSCNGDLTELQGTDAKNHCSKEAALGRINSWLGGCSIFCGRSLQFKISLGSEHDVVAHWGRSGGGFRE